MKKATLLALAAMTAVAASAQYTVDPTIATVLEGGKVGSVEYIALDEASVKAFENQGATCTLAGPNGQGDGNTQNLWVWDNTFTAGDSSLPGVGMHFDGYASFTVGTAGWSGAGYNINDEGGLNTTVWNDETHFHLAYMSPATVCPSVGLIIADGTDWGSVPAKISLGTAFDDNGTVMPIAGPKPTDEWQCIDITFADLKKLWSAFDYKAVEKWHGNIMSFLCGGTTGQTIAFDAVYFYNYGTAGLDNVEAATPWVVTSRTINVAGAQGIELFDITGKTVKVSDGAVLGIEELPAGIYVARAGKQIRKIVK